MQRAAVLIGVSSTGNLPKLQAVELGISQMQEWALGQGIIGDRLIVLTDKTEKVRAYQVADAIDMLVQRRDLDQLIVYFTGHGIHNRGDIWLLSGAPAMAAEAVNVEGSIEAARTCGISHVVFISDACRTAADGIQGLGIDGIDIFPNDPVDGMERPVDAYFACARGKPALEVRDPVQAARGFSGVYTEVLTECLFGKQAATLDLTEENGVQIAHVGAWKLADHMLAEVPVRLKAKLGKSPSINQTPVARITSRTAWISRLSAPQFAKQSNTPVETLGGRTQKYSNAIEAADWLIATILAGRTDASDNDLLGDEPVSEAAGDSLLFSTASALTVPFRPSNDIACGFKIRGAQVHAAYSDGVTCFINKAAKGSIVEVELKGKSAAILLELDDGASVLIPAITGFIGELTFKSGEFAHLTYEPVVAPIASVKHTSEQSIERSLVAAIGAAAGMGVLSLNKINEEKLTRTIDGDGTLNPSLALYLAYAYQEIGRRDRIEPMHVRLRSELGFAFYDIAMLAGGGALRVAQREGAILPPMPVLSRGWSLVRAFRAEMHPEMRELRSCLRPSLWTLFNSTGTKRLVNAIIERKILT